VLGEFLRAVGVAPRSLPATLGERTRLWRTITAENPVLLLLDDAASEAQVRPLLPAETSRVLVTSRRPLGGLDTSARLRLGPVDAQAAEAMLALPSNAPDAVGSDGLHQLVQACAGMPLALRLVAARMAMTPHIPLAAMADRLTRELSLDDLSSGDRRVASSIAASVRTLEPTALATVSDLAHLSLPTFTDWHLAALSGLTQSESNRMADELVASGLLDAAATNEGTFRYTLHDLVRVYLREQGHPLRLVALDRLLAWAVHLQLASLNSAIARPVPHVLWPPRPESLSDSLASRFTAQAQPWFEAEYPSLMALMDACVELGRPRDAGALLAAVRQPMTRAGLLEELIAAAQRCAAISGGDPLAHACAELVAGSAAAELGSYDVALQTIDAAMPDLDGADVCTLAGAWYEVGWLHHRNRGSDGAPSVVAAYLRSIELHRSIENAYGELGGLCGLVEVLHTGSGDNAQARAYAEQAHALAAQFDDYRTVIKVKLTVWRSLTDDLDARVDTLTQALRLAREHGDIPLTATCLTALAAALREAGEAPAALDAALEAVELARELRRPADLDAALAELGLVQKIAIIRSA
jgi:tetratricopeptide (TPR) repeat protein